MSNLQDLRILIVDDDPFMRNTIRAMLRVIGRFIVTEANDGETALQMIAARKPELVLCDINMEPMNGLRFVEQLRNHENTALRDVAVVMLTMHSDAATVEYAANLNIRGYLVKPVSPKQLTNRLQAIFRERRPAAALPAVQ
jgi:two-component system, chemotaxis family, chemotaxis protein CheY